MSKEHLSLRNLLDSMLAELIHMSIVTTLSVGISQAISTTTWTSHNDTIMNIVKLCSYVQCPEKRQTNITNNANNNLRCEVLRSLVACGRSTASIRCLPSSFEISTFRFGFRRKTRSRRKLASHVAISSLWKAHLGRAKKSCWHPCESVNPLSQGTDGMWMPSP